MVFIDPTTRKRIVTAKHVGDITYDLDIGDTAISEEDVPLIGPWNDYTGSDTNVNSKTQQQHAGLVNELQGTDAQFDSNGDLNNLTERGKTASTHRQRRIKVYKKL